MQNTLQNAGHRRSSSGARRASASRRHSSAAGISEEDPNKMRLQWDEANLYLAEQDKGGRMKITEPKTPYQYGDGGAMEEDEEEEDVAIDPRFVNVDEVDMAKKKPQKKSRESEIPGLDIGEPEDEFAQDASFQNSRVERPGSSNLSREGSKEKHVSVGGDDEGIREQVGMPTREEQEKHAQFEAQRRRHYEMRDIKGLLG
jgi:protein phosphatase inhibitor 2